MGAIGGAAKVAAGVAVAAIGAILTALAALGNRTAEYRKEQAKLNTAFLAAGSTVEQAAESYNNLYRFLGDSARATEAAAHLAKLTTEQQALAEWTTNLQGIYATFGDSLPIEGLAEAANETARVGTVTGTLADALNWAGVNEDQFNQQLAQCVSMSEREALIRGTLNNLYSDAALIYEKNNADLIAHNEAQARLNATTGQLGKAVMPLLTAFLNLSNVLLTALGPAISFIANAMAALINVIAKAVAWVSALISALGGGKKSSLSKAQAGISGVSGGISAAAGGAGALKENLEGAGGAAEKLKRITAGFDELNVIPSQQASGGGGGGGSAIEGGGGGGSLEDFENISLGTENIESAIESAEASVNNFISKVKKGIESLKDIFKPTIDAWKEAFTDIGEAWDVAAPDFAAGADSIKEGFLAVGSYLVGTFIPDLINSFNTTLAPIFGDIFSFALKDAGKTFELLGKLFEEVSNDIIIPALQGTKKVAEDTFGAIKKAWDKNGPELLTNVGIAMDGIRGFIEDLYYDVIEPIWEKLSGVFEDIWNEGLKPLVEEVATSASNIGNNLLILYNTIIAPIAKWVYEKIFPIIVTVFEGFADICGFTIKFVISRIQSVVVMLDGLIAFLTGVFTGDWEKAWNGVKRVLSGVWMSLEPIVKTPINAIIGLINKLLSGIGNAINTVVGALNSISVTIPKWVPKYGGKTFDLGLSEVAMPQIPKLATGGIITSATQIIAGERGKEAILPLETNTGWMDMLADKIASRTEGPSRIVLELDGKELGWANIRTINSITRQTGRIQLTV